ncbi:aspartate dehydrogenase [Paraburkholderia caffeinilytica]|uniref:aspartate dehydrogenase n=1 Tax=Paraburkholderia caffeinilytica TaxID=1761016 RepID=UPI0038BE06A7
MKIGLAGVGSVGKFVINEVNVLQKVPGSIVSAIYSKDPQQLDEFEDVCKGRFSELGEFLSEDMDLVVEATTVEAARFLTPEILESGRSMLLLSVGALVNDEFRQQTEALCRRFDVKVYVPSGAIGGLDAIRAAAALGGLNDVSITTTKPPASLDRALSSGTQQEIFNGSGAEAIDLFPKNVNVAVALALSGLGTQETRVRVVADPSTSRNRHFIEAEGEFGQLTVDLRCGPMAGNPRTSALAAASVIAALRNLDSPIEFV